MRIPPPRMMLLWGLVMTALGLGGCAELKLGATGVKTIQRGGDEPGRGIYKVGNAYQINGVWYTPAEDYAYAETGISSYYGGERSGVDFHGRFTANGEVYDMNALTAAHQTLPMPSLVRVTNLDNGRQMVLRVNDRGPFVAGRIIDVSRRSAQLLGFEDRGTARVRVEILADESRQVKAALTGKAPPTAETIAAAPRGSVSSDTLAPPSGARASTVMGTALPPPSEILPTAATGSADGRPVIRGEAGLPRPAPAVIAQAPVGSRVPPPPAAPSILAPGPAQVAALPPEAQARAVPTLMQTEIRATTLWVQAGAFSSYDNAARLSARLQRFGVTQITPVQNGAQQLYRVRVGPAQTIPAADKLLADVSNVAPGARITVE